MFLAGIQDKYSLATHAKNAKKKTVVYRHLKISAYNCAPRGDVISTPIFFKKKYNNQNW